MTRRRLMQHRPAERLVGLDAERALGEQLRERIRRLEIVSDRMPSSTTDTIATVPAASAPSIELDRERARRADLLGASSFTVRELVGVTRVDFTPYARSGMNASRDSRCGSLTRNALT